MVKGISGPQGPYQGSQPNGSITYAQAQQVEQNLEDYINSLPPNSGEFNVANQLLSQIQGELQPGPSKFNGAKMLQDIQLGLNATNPNTGYDLYIFSMQGMNTNSPATQSQVEDMLSQIFSNVQPSPTFTVPAPTLADNTYINIFEELQNIPASGADGQFKQALENAMQGISSGMSKSSLYAELNGISTKGVDPSIVSWYNSLL